MEASHDRMERLRASGRVVVSCVNGLPLSVLEQRFPGIFWIKAIPNVAAAVGRSVTLIAKGEAAEDSHLRSVEKILEGLGTVFRAHSDEQLDRLAAVTSCVPGILGAMLDEFAQAFELDEQQTRELLVASAAGSLALAERDAVTLRDLVSSVSNPGGLTEVGVSTIRSTVPAVLAELRDVLDRKRESRWRQYFAMNCLP
jgi:pyrroline-5-carboxylate reductase